MRFSDLKPGMVVSFKHGNVESWASFHDQLIRNPNYEGPQPYYETHVKRHENKPIIVREIKTITTGDLQPGPSYRQLVGVRTDTGNYVYISEKWFLPEDTDAFQDVKPSSQFKSELGKEVGTRRQKRILPALEKTFPTLPTDVLRDVAKFQVAPPKIAGRKRKTRKTRKLRKTRKMRK